MTKFKGLYVTSFGTLACVENWKKVLQEIVRVLKPGGIAIAETNRIYPFYERVIRNSAWLIKGKMSFRDAIKNFRPYSEPASGSFEPRKYAIKDIVGFLTDIGVEKIVIHDPSRAFIFHNFFWAITFVKEKIGNASPATIKVKYCPLCRRSRKWKLE